MKRNSIFKISTASSSLQTVSQAQHIAFLRSKINNQAVTIPQRCLSGLSKLAKHLSTQTPLSRLDQSQ
jgi:hypothetical protein